MSDNKLDINYAQYGNPYDGESKFAWFARQNLAIKLGIGVASAAGVLVIGAIVNVTAHGSVSYGDVTCADWQDVSVPTQTSLDEFASDTATSVNISPENMYDFTYVLSVKNQGRLALAAATGDSKAFTQGIAYVPTDCAG